MKRLLIIVAVILFAVSAHGIANVPASKTTCKVTTAAATTTCTLTAATTAGNDVKVGLSWKTTTRTISKVEGSDLTTVFGFEPYGGLSCNSTNVCTQIYICHKCTAQTSVKPTFSGTTLFVMNVDEYSGVGSIGISAIASGTSTAPSVSLTTGDANNFTVMQSASLGNAGIPTAGTGNLRTADRSGTTSSNVAGASCDNTVAGAGSVTCSVAITSGVWAATAVELRSVSAPSSYQWPNCDASHPCLIHSVSTVSDGTTEANNAFKLRVQPSLANNTLGFVITHIDTKTISTIVDDQSNSWGAARVSTDEATDQTKTEAYVVCGAATGTSEITITFSASIASGDLVHFHYFEMAGVPTTSCLDGTSSANALTSNIIQPGSITTASSGDVIFHYAMMSYPFPTSEDPMGPMKPQDIAGMVMQNEVNKFGASLQFQAAAGAINPAFYVSDKFARKWNSIAMAFKSSPGTGTMPSGINVTHIQHHYYPSGASVKASFPATGNLLILSTTNAADLYAISNLRDFNNGATYTRVSPSVTADPQIYFLCSATATTDLTYSFTHQNTATHEVFYDVAGARTGGATACLGTQVENNGSGSAVNADITNAPTITPSVANSLILNVVPFGTGPPTGPITAGMVQVSMYATGMSDTSNWDTGDAQFYYYNPNTSAYSFSWHMANSSITGWNALATEFLAPAAAGRHRQGWVF